MDVGTVVFWCLVGTLAGGLVGHLRGAMGLGMLCGLFLGPLIGPIVVMLLTLGGKKAPSATGSPDLPQPQP